MAAHDAESAWTALVRLGWTLYMPTGMPKGYALCPSCTANPTTVDDAVRAAKRGRKKRS
jgi:hypothetical protein